MGKGQRSPTDSPWSPAGAGGPPGADPAVAPGEPNPGPVRSGPCAASRSAGARGLNLAPRWEGTGTGKKRGGGNGEEEGGGGTGPGGYTRPGAPGHRLPVPSPCVSPPPGGLQGQILLGGSWRVRVGSLEPTLPPTRGSKAMQVPNVPVQGRRRERRAGGCYFGSRRCEHPEFWFLLVVAVIVTTPGSHSAAG